MFKKNDSKKENRKIENNKNNLNIKKKSNKQTNRNHTKKLPIFMVVGLVILTLLVIGIYYLFLNFKEIAILDYEGYAISGKEITETLLGNNAEEDNNKKNLFLTKVYEQDKLYKKLNDYFVGENKKEEINLSYPIYINDNTALYNLSQDMKLITSDFEEVSGYPSLTVSNGIIYNESDLERIDEKEYIFLKNENNIFTNLREIKIQTVANEYTIPVNSNIYFDKEEIRYYEIKKDTLRYKEIKDIDTQSKIKIGEKEVKYEELLTVLRLNQTENQVPEKEEEIIEEDTSKENEKKQEEVKKEESEEQEEPEVTEPGAYIKPEVTCSPFKAKVYTASTELTIKDPSSKILEPVTFIFRKDGRIYLRKTYTSSGEIEVKGLSPNTSYEIEGSYVYENEAGQKVENTFYKDSITTTGFENLDPITLSFENGEIFSNKIQLKNLKITSDIQNEAVKGIKRLEVEIGDVIYKLTGENLRKFINGEAIVYETAEGMKSNQKVHYTIKLYDNQGNELRVENNRGETRTSKQKPSVNIRLNKQNVIEVEIGLNLNNKDNVSLENYRYQITRPNGEIVKEAGLKENDNSIYLNDLDPNQYYTITVYASYDLEDNKGKQENQVIGQTVFATQPLSTLGYLELDTNLTEVQTDSGTVEIGINEDRTDKRLIQILDEIKIELVELGKYEGGTSGVGETKEGNIIETVIITGEELKNLKQGEIKTQIFEDLISNTKYSLKITSKVKQGETIEEVQVTYSLKEIVTLKMPAEVQMKNLFVTGDLIDFDVRIEDIDKAVLTSKVRMELRDEKTNLIKLEEINTNEDYVRKTIEKLETGKTYTLSFYADQYNEGNTDETYKANYLLKELKIVTETGITGSIGLTNLSRKATGKNLVDMSSEIKWYVYPNFNTSSYYGKEYNQETKILTLGGHGNYRRAVYDLEEYAGQEVTMSFKAKLVGEGANGNSTVYIQNKKTDGNFTKVNELITGEWKNYEFTLTLDATGYLGFYIQGGNGVEIKELQIELGNRKTNYEEYQYTLESEILVNLEDKKGEISTKDYYIKIYENDKLIKEERYEEMNENNQVVDKTKTYPVKENTRYTLELVVKMREREYVLGTQEFETEEGIEIKGIQNDEQFLEIQPKGNYVLLNDINMNGSFGSTKLEFDGTIDGNGHSITVTGHMSGAFNQIGVNGILENIVFNLNKNSSGVFSGRYGVTVDNYGTLRNNKFNLIENSKFDHVLSYLMGHLNYGTVENFVVNLQVPMYGIRTISTGFWKNYGTIQNGYIYGENIDCNVLESYSGDTASAGLVSENYGSIRNVYSLISVDVKENYAVKDVGNIVCYNGSTGVVENVYSVGIGKGIDLTYGPTIYANSGIANNVYYFADEIFNNTYNLKTTMLALKDISFQEQILNNQNAFEVEELVSKNYYPHLRMPDCMPKQEYIELPTVKDEDLADIISIEVLEQGTDHLKAKVNVNNPSGETITEIKVKDLDCRIVSQEYKKGKSNVIIELTNPIRYISSYSVLSITTKGAFNIPYTRTFKENERVLRVDLYREIYTVQDWKDIRKSLVENYQLMNDLDFSNSDVYIGSTFEGKLDGNGHVIKNIRNNSAIFDQVKEGEIRDLTIENVTRKDVTGGSTGFIGTLTRGTINGFHINNMVIDIAENNSGKIKIGGIVNYAESGKIINSSVTNYTVVSEVATDINSVGAILAYGYSIQMENCYVQDLNYQIKNALYSGGVGGVVGILESGGEIKNCYATGKIESTSDIIGGIIGDIKNTNVKVENTYSLIHIKGIGEYIGGIAGNTLGGYGLQRNLSLGNIYTRKDTQNIGRISGDQNIFNNQYAYQNQLINGYIQTDSAEARLLSRKELMDENIYRNNLNFQDAFDYAGLEKGVLPKLKNIETGEILQNQKDILLEGNSRLMIQKVEYEKTDVNHVKIRLEIENSKKIEIQEIEIDDMETKLQKQDWKDGISYVEVEASPIRYYDSYAISKIHYIEEQKAKEIETEAKINLMFFKEIYTYEDWQNIEGTSYENYRLMSDIDFSGKNDIKCNLCMNRLVSDGKALKNIKLTWNTRQNGLIKQMKSELRNIRFENIDIENTASGNYAGIILSSSADIDILELESIQINAKNMNYVAPISNVELGKINGVMFNNVKVNGMKYTAGLIGRSKENVEIGEVNGDSIIINASGPCSGGVLGAMENGVIQNVEVEDSEIRGTDYVGGIVGSGGVRFGRMVSSEIEGKTYVGGVAGILNRATDEPSDQEFIVEKCKIFSAGRYLGGIAGFMNYGTQRCVVEGCLIEGTTVNADRVGGVAGYVMFSSIGKKVVKNTQIKSLGNDIGGIVGYYECEVLLNGVFEDGFVEGTENVGGIVGSARELDVAVSYTNSLVKATEKNAGGIIGYLKNAGMTATINNSNLYYTYYANNKIQAPKNVGGLIGNIAEDLYTGGKYFYSNYVEAELESEDPNTVSLGIGGRPDQNQGLIDCYYYQYSKINGENPNIENEPFIEEEQYLKEADLKIQSTYNGKLGWSTSYFDLSVLANDKYPILKGIEDQEGIDIPKDSEHMVGENAEINTLSEQENANNLEMKKETLQESFAYEGKTIQTYETYTKITLENGATLIRPERIYVKEGKVYILDGNLEMVVNNFVVDSYNGKEYETILGTDGRLYDLKESLHYPENFQNKDIKEIGNNLEKEAKEITVTYKDGSYVRFNYQTGEILEEEKVEQEVSLFSYIAEAFQKENVMLEPSKESYEESKELIGKLEKLPIEEAIERKEISNGNITNQITQNETIENQVQEETNNQINQGITSKEKEYISKYNSKTGEYEVYDKEEILESKESEVISEEEKIEKENLKEYYSEGKRAEEKEGIVWIMLSIAGAVIILIILGRKITAKRKRS